MILRPVAMLAATGAATAPSSKMPRSRRRPSSSRSSTIGASGPRSHSPIGASKPCFGRSTIAFGMRRSSSRRSRYLLRPFFSFSDGRHGRGELEQLVIEQRLARFERHRHAHPVDLGHDVVDEIGLDVHVQRAIERIASTGRRRRRARKPANGSASRHLVREVARVERVARVRLELAVGVLLRAASAGDSARCRSDRAPLTPSGSAAGQPAGDAAAGRTEPPPRRQLPALDAVARVAGPQLVAAVARQRDGDVLARRLRDVVGRHRGRIGERLVEMPGQLRQQIDDVGADDLLVLLDAEMPRDRPRVLELVEPVLVEADRRRHHPPGRRSRPSPRRPRSSRCRRRETRRAARR